uniref:Uncharacterized protein n=1 Tax=Anolis carolinensis TaxID=28377 RepID=A0A803TTT7_ANOCA
MGLFTPSLCQEEGLSAAACHPPLPFLHKHVVETLIFFFLQTCLFTHSSRNIIMSVIFSYKSYYWPVFFWLIGVKGDEFICAEKHLHLRTCLNDSHRNKFWSHLKAGIPWEDGGGFLYVL